MGTEESVRPINIKLSDVNALEEGTALAKRLITVDNNWSPSEGAKLGSYTIGSALGKGLQGGVYNLVQADGKVSTTRVLKAAHKFAPLVALEREWEVGLRVHNLDDKIHSLPGFMGTAEGVVTEKGNKFKGMLLEKLRGRDTLKVLDAEGFHDIGYLRDMMFCVLTSLDIAQRSIGFHHSDFRVANIMELLAESTEDPPGPNHLTRWRVIDYGLADFSADYARGKVNLRDARGEKVRRDKRGQLEAQVTPPKRKGKLLPAPLSLSKLAGIPKVNPFDRLYRYMWNDRSDVYGLVWDVIRYIDGLVWLRSDEREVRLLMAFIHHVSGMRCRCYFVDKVDDKVPGLHPCGPLRFNSGALHFFRVRYIRVGAWLRPKNKGLTAAEALTAPFFDACKDDSYE